MCFAGAPSAGGPCCDYSPVRIVGWSRWTSREGRARVGGKGGRGSQYGRGGHSHLPATAASSSSESSPSCPTGGRIRWITSSLSSKARNSAPSGPVMPRPLRTARGSFNSRSLSSASVQVSATSNSHFSSQFPVGSAVVLAPLSYKWSELTRTCVQLHVLPIEEPNRRNRLGRPGFLEESRQ